MRLVSDIVSENIPLVFIYKFRENEILLRPPGEPRDHRQGDVLQGRVKSILNIILFFSFYVFLWALVPIYLQVSF